MSIDVEKLIQPLSEESPAGENLEYDNAFTTMEREAEGKPEQQMGDSVVEAEGPNWKEVKTHALDVLERSRDIRAVVYLARAVLATEGVAAFADGLALVRGYLENLWEPFHPQLDPDDEFDPTMRVNALSAISDADATVKEFREAALVTSQVMGKFSLRDVEIANGTTPAPADPEAEVPNMQAIDAAFLEAELEGLQATADAVNTSIEHMGAIEAKVVELAGVHYAIDFFPLTKELKAANVILSEQLARRGVGEAVEGEAAVGADGNPITGEVRTREDVMRVLDKCCDYFARNEPSSPVPLLLQRAKRLVSKNFMEIMADLAPSGVAEAEVFRGLDSE